MFYKYFSTILFSVTLLTSAAPVLGEMVSINSQDVNIRKGPGKGHEIIWEYGKGFPLKVLKVDGEWLNIEDFEGDKGWVHRSLTHKNPYVIVKANKSGKTSINIRRTPSTKADVIAHAKYGVVFKTIKQENGWAKIEHEDKKIVGWVKRSLLWGF